MSPLSCRGNPCSSLWYPSPVGLITSALSGEPSPTSSELLAVAGRVYFFTSGSQQPVRSPALVQVNLGLFHEQVNKPINSMLFSKQNKTTPYVFAKANYERWKTCFLLLYSFSWASWHVWHPSFPRQGSLCAAANSLREPGPRGEGSSTQLGAFQWYLGTDSSDTICHMQLWIGLPGTARTHYLIN